jgi:hypothetical protein
MVWAALAVAKIDQTADVDVGARWRIGSEIVAKRGSCSGLFSQEVALRLRSGQAEIAEAAAILFHRR